uniref:C2H2-type domain-containing protein n=1 Tax=Anopheles maculatus TaxID=74869 RepID=A0A182TBC7_9DIPT
MPFTSRPEELSIFPINLEMKKPAILSCSSAAKASYEEDDGAEEIELVLPAPARPMLETASNRSILRNPLPLLQEMQRNGHLQELTITEQRRSLPVPVINGHHQNGLGVQEVSTSVSPCIKPKLDSVSSSGEVQNHDSTVTLTELLQSESVFQAKTLLSNNGTIDKPSTGQKEARKRRTRKTISANDPAEALTEMSVRGLNLFRYATVNAGTYQCLECVKEGIEKTFKNKYSFQRHAFLYHEGKQRKVFPCPMCNKEFSRPDKMKSHLRMVHESYEAKIEAPPLPSPSVLAAQHHHQQQHNGELTPVHTHPEQPQSKPPQHHQHHHQYQAEITNPNQLHEEQRRRQQEQDVMKIRSVVHAINLRQLQQLQQHAQELRIRQSLEEQNQPKPGKHVMDAASVPTQLIPLNGIGSQ